MPVNPFRRPPNLRHHEITDPTCLATFVVGGRAVPWKVPEVRRNRNGQSYTVKNKRLIAWQEAVACEAREAWGCGRAAYRGLVGISLWFYIHPPTGRVIRTADVTNLVKAFEDSIKGIIIEDDREVFAHHSERYLIPREETEKVYAQIWAMPFGAIEPDDPGPYAYRPWQWVESPVSATG